jgi:hypothetical protein
MQNGSELRMMKRMSASININITFLFSKNLKFHFTLRVNGTQVRD